MVAPLVVQILRAVQVIGEAFRKCVMTEATGLESICEVIFQVQVPSLTSRFYEAKFTCTP